MPIVNGWVEGYEVDFLWPDRRLNVETDGRSVHGTPIAFERDHRRDLDLELAGWHVLRFTWRQVVESPGRVAATLHRRLPVKVRI
jgi:very-short-patch-repair endonuclease